MQRKNFLLKEKEIFTSRRIIFVYVGVRRYRKENLKQIISSGTATVS